MIEIVGTNRMGMQFHAGGLAIHTSVAASRGTTSSAVRPEGKRSSTTSIHGGRDSERASGRSSRGRCRSGSGRGRSTITGAAQCAFGDREKVVGEIALGDAGLRKQHLAGVGEGDLPAVDRQEFLLAARSHTVTINPLRRPPVRARTGQRVTVIVSESSPVNAPSSARARST
jgi:hypothetical protein